MGDALVVFLGGSGLATCFVLALLAPLIHGLRLLGGRIALQLRRRRAAGEAPRLRDAPLQPDLPEAYRRLAADTRAVLVDLEHACARAHRWSDRPAGGWWQRIFAAGSDVAYRPTIGMTGEVWRWLQQAEALADADDESHARALGMSAAAVRRVLFEERPLVDRLAELALLLAEVDGGLRIQGGSPYRDSVTPRLQGAQHELEAQQGQDECGAEQEQRHRNDGSSEPDRRREYEAVLCACRPEIVAIVRRFADAAERDDLLQEIHLAIWSALARYRGECSLRTYVLRIARYRAITFAQRRPRFAGERQWADDAPPLDESLDETRRCRAVVRAIQRLPATLRHALQLRLQGYSYREIGEQLAITEKNASVRVTRARRSLGADLVREPELS